MSRSIVHMPHDTIAIAGSGPVAKALGRLLHTRGVPIAAVASRSATHAAEAAAYIGDGVRAVEYEHLSGEADRILIAVTDRAIEDVAGRIGGYGDGRVALHTCGAKGPDALATLQARGYACGVLHPLQTVPSADDGVRALPGVCFGLSGDAAAEVWASELVARLDGVTLRVKADGFARYHASAVLAGNGAFALVEAAVELMHDAGIERAQAVAALAPLCRRSLDNALQNGPGALTGPVARGDAGTVRAHLDGLASATPQIGALYRAIGLSLAGLARGNGLSEQALHELEDALTS